MEDKKYLELEKEIEDKNKNFVKLESLNEKKPL